MDEESPWGVDGGKTEKSEDCGWRKWGKEVSKEEEGYSPSGWGKWEEKKEKNTSPSGWGKWEERKDENASPSGWGKWEEREEGNASPSGWEKWELRKEENTSPSGWGEWERMEEENRWNDMDREKIWGSWDKDMNATGDDMDLELTWQNWEVGEEESPWSNMDTETWGGAGDKNKETPEENMDAETWGAGDKNKDSNGVNMDKEARGNVREEELTGESWEEEDMEWSPGQKMGLHMEFGRLLQPGTTSYNMPPSPSTPVSHKTELSGGIWDGPTFVVTPQNIISDGPPTCAEFPPPAAMESSLLPLQAPYPAANGICDGPTFVGTPQNIISDGPPTCAEFPPPAAMERSLLLPLPAPYPAAAMEERSLLLPPVQAPYAAAATMQRSLLVPPVQAPYLGGMERRVILPPVQAPTYPAVVFNPPMNSHPFGVLRAPAELPKLSPLLLERPISEGPGPGHGRVPVIRRRTRYPCYPSKRMLELPNITKPAACKKYPAVMTPMVSSRKNPRELVLDPIENWSKRQRQLLSFAEERRSAANAAAAAAAGGWAYIEDQMPIVRTKDEYYTIPGMGELGAKERATPGFCKQVENFIIGRQGCGHLKLEGETDVRGFDVEAAVEFSEGRVVIYEEEKVMNKKAKVTLVNIKCRSKRTGRQIRGGAKMRRFREKLNKRAEEMGAVHVSYDPGKEEWVFECDIGCKDSR